MQHLRRSLSLAAGIAAIAIVLTATGAGPAIAQGVKPFLATIVNDASTPVPVESVRSRLTHVGRPAGDIVQLSWWSASQCFKRIDPTGLVAPDCYVAPAGHTVVITDVQWATSAVPGTAIQVLLFNQGIVFVGRAVADANGIATLDHQSQTGFIFSPGLQVTPGAPTALLRGYLVPVE